MRADVKRALRTAEGKWGHMWDRHASWTIKARLLGVDEYFLSRTKEVTQNNIRRIQRIIKERGTP